jgi:hypothetical protein
MIVFNGDCASIKENLNDLIIERGALLLFTVLQGAINNKIVFLKPFWVPCGKKF